jgi:hypothetical protein
VSPCGACASTRKASDIGAEQFHPAWHRLLGKGVAAGLTAAWTRPAGQVRRAAAFLVWTQAEAGTGCPLSMTHAAVPALRADPELAAEWEPRLTSVVYDRGLRPAHLKAGVLFGMGMTEKQGGSDVRANTTVARPLAEAGTYELTGLVDPVAVAVVAAQARRVVVGLRGPLLHLRGARRAAEPRQLLADLVQQIRPDVPFDGLDERPVGGEDVVAGQRRRLVRHGVRAGSHATEPTRRYRTGHPTDARGARTKDRTGTPPGPRRSSRAAVRYPGNRGGMSWGITAGCPGESRPGAPGRRGTAAAAILLARAASQ